VKLTGCISEQIGIQAVPELAVFRTKDDTFGGTSQSQYGNNLVLTI
jgi:hypothetical protein